MAYYQKPDTSGIGANDVPLSPGLSINEIPATYAEIAKKTELRRAMQTRKLAPQSGATTGAYPGKSPIVDPKTV